ncbi:SDR family NAD(P)-dependent oxidoreductase [Streptomyces sp. DSM 41033]|uniref:SDR family NAD(P)-dependent oxidoreductase n=1 Tax=Streptomyces sp. DSM 41033 TaxID=3448655 RepID=UPI0040402C14
MHHSRLAETPIAIVGLAGLFPQSRNVREFWHNIVDGNDCIEDVPDTHWNLDDYYDPDPAAEDKTYARRGGFLPEIAFNPMEFGLPPNTLEVTDILQLLSLTVARDVLRDAGTEGSGWYDPTRTGVILGVTGANSLTQPLSARLQTPVLKEVVRSVGLSEAQAEEVAERFKKAYIPWEENSFPGMLGNVVAGRIANRFDLGGTNCTVDAACASALAAVKLAVSELVEGRSDLMITGGCDAENTILMYMCFSKTPAFSKSQIIRPFDESADGTLIGEGIGMLALKRLADAERDGDRIYSVLRGIGTSSDGRFKSIYAPRAQGQQLALRRAYEDADVPAGSIELFEAHGTGTAVGDHTELSALGSFVAEGQDARGYAAIGSVKSQIGHTKAAAGAAGLIKLSLALHQKVLPPTINVEQPSAAVDPAETPFYVNSQARPWIADPGRDKRRAAVSSFGFGGTNFHMVLEEHDTTGGKVLGPVARTGLWHAADPEALARRLEQGAAPDPLGWVPAGDARIGIVARSDEEFEALRTTAVELLRAKAGADAWQHPKGITYRRSGIPAGTKAAAVFAGQGSQYVGMGREAALAVPPVLAAYDRANRLTAGAETLGRVVFPPPAFDDATRTAQEESLRRTEFAQPAIGALSAGQFAWFKELGFAPDGVIGHSFGELTALWAAGVLDDDGFTELARARGLAMAPPADASDHDSGAMAAVRGELSAVEALVAGYRDVSVCNINAPGQIVVGGPTAEIDRLVADSASGKVPAKRLPVSAAFHTRFVAHAADAFREAVEGVALNAPRIPVYANTPGAAYGADQAESRRTLVDQLLRPVAFADRIEEMYADGFRVFVEFGPKRVLSDLVDRVLEGREGVRTVAVDGGPAKDGEIALKRAVIELAVLGLPVTGIDDHSAEAPEVRPGKGMAIPLRGINYVTDARRSAYREALAEPSREALPTARPEPVAELASEPGSEPVSEPVAPSREGTAESLSAVAKEGLDLQAEILDAHVSTIQEAVKTLEESVRSGTHPDADAALRLIEQHGASITTAHERATRLLIDALKGEETPTAPAAPAAAPVASVAPAVPVAVAPVEAPAPAQVAAEPAVSAPSGEVNAAVLGALLEVVAEKTGYPVEMLDPGMDVEADLGIDSIKRVQIMGALQERFPVSGEVDPERMGELRTLDDIAGFLASASGATTPAPAEPAAAPAPASVAPVAAAPAAPAPSGEVNAAVLGALLEVVAEKTGYPVEMLEPGMDVEADLGIDSIKRVQIMGALQERFPVSGEVDPERMGELRTLDDIAGFLASASGATVAAPAPVAPVATEPAAPAPSGEVNAAVLGALLEVVAEKTGYPVEMLEPGMDVEADLGIDSIKRVQIMGALQERFPVSGEVDPERMGELRTLDDIAGFLASASGPAPTPDGSPVEVSAPAVETPLVVTYPQAAGVGRTFAAVRELPAVCRVVRAYAEQPVALVLDDGSTLTRPLVAGLRADGWRVEVVVLPGVTTSAEADAVRPLRTWDEQELASAVTAERLDLVVQMAAEAGQEWAGAARRLAHTVLVAKVTQAPLKAAAGDRAAFVAVTRLDGANGYRGGGTGSALLGGVSGLVKTLAIEVPALFTRTVDFAPGLDDRTVAARFLDEIHDVSSDLSDVGVDPEGRRTIVPSAEPPAAHVTAVPEIGAGDLLVVTGGARGITADCLQALVQARPAGLLLLGRSRVTPEPTWSAGAEGAALKGLIAKRITASGEKATPRGVEAVYREVTGSREIQANLDRLRATGATVEYLVVDITDAAAVRTALAPYAARVTGVVHGAGVLADRLIADKTAEEIDRVLGTKIVGLGNVLDAVRGSADLRHLVFFSSVAGFFGNRGQSDYAVANEALNRLAVRRRQELPSARVTSVNWGAWDGGMVTDDLRRMFASRGVALVPVATGAGMFAEQFTAARGQDTVVVAGPLTPLSAPPADGSPAAPTLLVDRTLADISADPLLADHTIGGKRVLPATAALGALVNTTERVTGRPVTEVSAFKVFKGLVLDAAQGEGADASRLRLFIEPGPATRPNAIEVLASAVDDAGRSRPSYGASLSTDVTPAPADRADLARAARAANRTDAAPLYRDGTLFHGPALRGIRSVLVAEEGLLLLGARLGDGLPARGAYHGRFHSPVIADLLLQSALVWVRRFRNRASLPLEIGSARFHAELPADREFLIAVENVVSGPSGITCTITALDQEGRVLQVLDGVVVVEDAQLEGKFGTVERTGTATVSV